MQVDKQGKVCIKIADWEKDNSTLKLIRKTVFIDEQKVPEELEWDEHDISSIHFLASVENTDCATARLKSDGQIGRMAVLPGYRHKCIGSQLLTAVLKTASENKMERVFLHAQVQVVGFYQQHGFTAQGDVFMDAGILHRTMWKNLSVIDF